MRDLTKSMLRFSWAMPLFGMNQLTNLSLPTRSNQDKVVDALDAVSDAARDELGSGLADLYDTGDRVQRGVVELTFRAFMLDLFDPARWLPGGDRATGSRAHAPATGPGPAAPPYVAPARPSSSPAPPSSSGAPAPSGGAPAPAQAPRQPGWGPMPK